MKTKMLIIITLVFMLFTINTSAQEVKNTLTFSSKDISSEGFELTYVEAVKHTMTTVGKQYDSMVIQLANYDRNGRSYHPNAKEEGQRRVTVSFSAPSGKKLKKGSYSLDGSMAKDYRLSVGIERKGKSIGLYNGAGSGEILFLDDKTIKAKVKVQDERGTTIESTFSTKWEKPRY